MKPSKTQLDVMQRMHEGYTLSWAELPNLPMDDSAGRYRLRRDLRASVAVRSTTVHAMLDAFLIEIDVDRGRKKRPVFKMTTEGKETLSQERPF